MAAKFRIWIIGIGAKSKLDPENDLNILIALNLMYLVYRRIYLIRPYFIKQLLEQQISQVQRIGNSYTHPYLAQPAYLFGTPLPRQPQQAAQHIAQWHLNTIHIK